MKKETKEKEKEAGLLKKTMEFGGQVAQVGIEAARLKDRAEHVVEDSFDAAKRAVKRGRYAAEDLLDDAAYRIKRDPLNSVAVTLGIGFGLGVLVGWFLARNENERR